MTEMRKLESIVLERDIDTILQFLGDASVVQFINMRDRFKEWEDILDSYEIPTEALSQCSTILTRIDHLVKALELKLEDLTIFKVSLPEKPPEEVLKEAELRLSYIEERSKEVIEALSHYSKILSRIDRLFRDLKVKPEELLVEKISLKWIIPHHLPEKPLKEIESDILAEIRNKVAQIESHIRKVSLEKLIESSERDVIAEEVLMISTTVVEVKRQFSSVKDSLAEEAQKIKTIIAEINNQLPKLKTDLIKEALTIKKIAESERKSIKTKNDTRKFSEELSLMRSSIQMMQELMEVKGNFGRTAKVVYFEAWVPQTHMEMVVSSIKEITSGNCIITSEAPAHEELVPTILKYPGFMQTFRSLTTAFGYPSGNEINPISLMAVTFPILFGIMFADVGQGMIFVILGGLLTYFKKKVKMEKIGEIVRYVLVSSELFILIGVSAIFFGFLFGEFFGPSGIIHPISLGRLGPFYFGGFEPTHEPMKMLRFAMFAGVAHIGLGIILRALNEMKKRHYKLVPIAICWLWLLLGGLFMWAYWGGISNISKWFAEGLLMLGGLVILPLMLIILFTRIAEGLMEGIGFGVEVFAETLSHTLSYCRLMALGLVHSVMNNLFLKLGGVEHGYFPPMSIPLIAIGTILVMTVEGLIVFVHTLRLHWIEWFSKFYKGEGNLFKPFTTKAHGQEGD